MLSDLQLVYMVPRNSTQLLKINTTKFQVEREPVYIDSFRQTLSRLIKSSSRLKCVYCVQIQKSQPLLSTIVQPTLKMSHHKQTKLNV